MATEVYQIAALLDQLVAAIDAARIAAAGNKRWSTAIETAASWLLEQDTITFDAERHELTVNSPSGRTYHANGACQCEAFAQSNACWHRAAARLVRRALELGALVAPSFARGQRVKVINPRTFGFGECGTVQQVEASGVILLALDNDGPGFRAGFSSSDLEAAPARASLSQRLSAARALADVNELFA